MSICTRLTLSFSIHFLFWLNINLKCIFTPDDGLYNIEVFVQKAEQDTQDVKFIVSNVELNKGSVVNTFVKGLLICALCPIC